MSSRSFLTGLVRSLMRSPEAQRAARDLARSAADRLQGRGPSPRPSERDASRVPGEDRHRAEPRSPGTSPRALADRPSGPPLALTYAPVADDRADPGEIVWSWVTYEEDIARGKDRPVLVLAREAARAGGHDGEGEVLVALMLTSHDRGCGTHTDERGATWIDIGSGPWDGRGRASEVRVDRLLRLPIDAVRREGSRLDARRFAEVADATRRAHRWDR